MIVNRPGRWKTKGEDDCVNVPSVCVRVCVAGGWAFDGLHIYCLTYYYIGRLWRLSLLEVFSETIGSDSPQEYGFL